MKLCDVIVVGEIYADHIFAGFEEWPHPGQEIYTDQYTRDLGGGAANTACALARLGRRTAIMGVVHESEEWIEERLSGFGVDSSLLRTSSVPTGVTAGISTRKDRTFVTYRGANKLLPSYLATKEAESHLITARHVHFAMPLDSGYGEDLLKSLKDQGCTVSLDCGYQEEWLRTSDSRNVCRLLDYFLPNEEEGRLMTGNESPSDILAALSREGISCSVLKLGAAGAATIAGSRLLHVQSPSVTVLDTTGAGDAFDAGLVDALLDELPVADALQRACICGALATRGLGALCSLPDRKELKAYYGKSKE